MEIFVCNTWNVSSNIANKLKSTLLVEQTSSHQWGEERLEGQDKMGMGLRDKFVCIKSISNKYILYSKRNIAIIL